MACSVNKTVWRDPVLWFLIILGFTPHFFALRHQPLYAYGLEGGELLPHIQRLYAEHLLDAQGIQTLLRPMEALRALDGQYPALLHLWAALWRRAWGGSLDDFALVASLNGVFLAAIGLFVGLMARDWVSQTTPPPGEGGPPPASFPYIGLMAMLLPGLYFPTRIHYYDLPMTAFILGAGWALLSGKGLRSLPRSLVGGILAGLAGLIKWAAVLYLVPIGLMALARSGWMYRAQARAGADSSPSDNAPSRLPPEPTSRTRLCVHAGLALLLALLLTLPLALKPDGSFAFQRQVGLEAPAQVASPWSGMLWYVKAGVQGGLGLLGALLLAAGLLAPLLVRTLERSHSRSLHSKIDANQPLPITSYFASQLFIITSFLTITPFIYLLWRVPVWDGRYLQPLLPWWALLLGISGHGLTQRPDQTQAASATRSRLLLSGMATLLVGQVWWLDLKPQWMPFARWQEHWQERWWIPATLTKPSRLALLRPAYELLRARSLQPRLVLDSATVQDRDTWIWLYMLEEQGGSLVSWPAPDSTGATSNAPDAVVIYGEPSPQAPSDWRAAYEKLTVWTDHGVSVTLYARISTDKHVGN